MEVGVRVVLKAWLGFALGVTIAVGLAGVPAAAADRPLTPMGLRIWVCDIHDGQETICGEFRNSEDSKVIIENQVYENGTITTAGLQFDCEMAVSDGAKCMIFGFDKVGFGQFQLLGVKWNTTYCISLRTRRVDDGLVSAAWSAPVCVRIPPLPPLPSPPGVAVSYLGAIWSGGKQVPQQVKVTEPNETQDGWSADVSFNNKLSTARGDAGWTYTVQDPDALQRDDHLAIQVCVTNPAGRVCSSKVVSILNQMDISVDGKSALPIKVTGRAAGSAPPPDTRPASLFDGTWNVTSSQGGSFTINVLLVNSTRMGVAISGSDASQKGDGSGRQIDTTHAEWNFTQPALGRGGTIDVTVTGNGSTFTGLGQATGGGAITWTGIKTTPPQPAH
jgi:hypothetical protein